MTDARDAENAAFCLPSHFLPDDFFAEENPKPDPTNKKYYDLFSSTGFGSDPFDSPIHSPPDTDGNSPKNDDVSLLSNLNRHFAHISLNHSNRTPTPEKPRLFSTSPQSTLSGFGSGYNRSGLSSNGSPNGPSPPLTPELKDDAAWELLYEAASEVARLKINAMAAAHMNSNNGRGLLGAPGRNSGFGSGSHQFLNPFNNQEVKWDQNGNNHLRNQGNCCGYHHQTQRSCGGPWPPVMAAQPPHHHHQLRAASGMYQGGPGVVVPTIDPVKRRSTGTGVFLPRRISTSPPRHNQYQRSELRTKPTVAQPAAKLEEANLNFQSGLSGTNFTSDHEIMWARRNVMLGQQRKISENNKTQAMVGQGQGQGQELSLPNDWSY